MAIRRPGWSEAYGDARLSHLTGVTYPAPPGALYIALYRGCPLSDGSDAAGLELLRIGPVTFAAPATDSGASSAFPVDRYIQPTADPSFTPPGTPAAGLHINTQAWGLMTAANGGVPIYVGMWAGSLLVGVATSISAAVFRVYAEAA